MIFLFLTLSLLLSLFRFLSPQSFLLSVSRSLLSSSHGEDSLSRSALGGRGFRSAWQWVSDRWPWASDRTAVGFRSNFRLWVLGLMGFACRGHRGSWVWWVLFAALSSASLSSSHQWGFSLNFFFRCGVDFWMDADYGDSELVVGLGLLLNVDGWLCWMLMGLII